MQAYFIFALSLFCASLVTAYRYDKLPTEAPIVWTMQSNDSGGSTYPRINDPCEVIRVAGQEDIGNVSLVIDPCMDEENRKFMECVLFYDPNLSPNDTNYNKGTCQCYRDWSREATRSPAYNHSLDPASKTHDWFIYNSTFKECVVKDGKRCAPVGFDNVPYRCEWKPNQDGKWHQGRCVVLDPDPNYRICTVDSGACPPSVGTPKYLLMLIGCHLLSQRFLSSSS